MLQNDGYNVNSVENGAQCLEELEKNSYDILILDLRMPILDGYQVLEVMRKNSKMSNVPVIVISASDSMDDVIKSISLGAADHLPKPFDPILLQARLNATLKAKLLQDSQENYRRQLEKRVQDQVRQIEDSLRKAHQMLDNTVLALSSVVEIRDIYTAGHQQRVSQLACAIAEKLGLSKSRIEGMRVAAILHDIGKIAIPAEILSKPGKLHPAEFEVIKLHSEVARKILCTIDFPWPVPEIVVQHHERNDGSGYPAGLTGKDLLLESRVIQVADIVEAMTSHRPYRPALGREAADKQVKVNRGTFYDAEVVDAYLQLKDFNFL
jgi:putative two-component system response regulator